MKRRVASLQQKVSCLTNYSWLICESERGDLMAVRVKRMVRRMTPKEITLIYLLFALFFSLVGFVYADTTSESINFDFNGLEAPGIGFIFANNIGFFSLVCILPFLNFIMYAIQFLAIGNNVFQIQALPFEIQANLLYRHALFEVMALSISIYVSYEIYNALYDYLHNSIKAGRKTYVKIILSYVIIIILTLVGACLEGTINV